MFRWSLGCLGHGVLITMIAALSYSRCVSAAPRQTLLCDDCGDTRRQERKLLEIPAASASDEQSFTSDWESTSESPTARAYMNILKLEILGKLGMVEPPTAGEIARANISKESMDEMFQRYNESARKVHELRSQVDQPQQSYMDMRVIFDQVDWQPEDVSLFDWYGSRNLRLFFPLDFPEGVVGTVETAVLRLFFIPTNRTEEGETVRIVIYELLAPVRYGKPPLRRNISIEHVSLSGSGWVSFPVQEAAEMWVADPASNYGLEVECDLICSTHIIVNGLSANREASDGENRSPRLDIVTRQRHELPTQRQRRHADYGATPPPELSCDDIPNKEGCCRRNNFTVSFAELNYTDWIWAPLEYNAYYCAGHCPNLYHVADTHAMIRALLRMKDPSSSPQLCCAPSVLGMLPILHLYRDENGNVRPRVTPVPDMVVERCNCT